jgi:hypothetical protein
LPELPLPHSTNSSDSLALSSLRYERPELRARSIAKKLGERRERERQKVKAHYTYIKSNQSFLSL